MSRKKSTIVTEDEMYTYDNLSKLNRLNKYVKRLKLGCFSKLTSDIDELINATNKYLIEKDMRDEWNIPGLEFEYGVEDKGPFTPIGIFTYNCIMGEEFESPKILLKISFPDGGYTFGSRFDVGYFDSFFKELLWNTNPDYRTYNAFYYTSEKAAMAYQTYKEIYQRYVDNYPRRMKELDIDEAIKSIKKLASSGSECESTINDQKAKLDLINSDITDILVKLCSVK